jgi:hypothetical protein
MKKILLSSFVAAACAVGSLNAQLISGSDNADNYVLDSDLNGANGGTGFSPWAIVSNNDPGGDPAVFAGAFVGDNLTQNGRASIGSPTQIIGLYANPGGAFVDLRRTFVGGVSMVAGDSFSWQGSWSWNGGNRGFSLYSDGTGYAAELLNLNHGGGNALDYSITGGANGVGLADIFNQAFTVNMTFLGGAQNELQLQLSTGSESFDQTFALSGVPNSFKWYFSGAPDGSANYEPVINNFSTTAVPEPSTYALLTLGALAFGGYAARRRARK